MNAVLPVHPFPARMAPEIALAEVTALQPDSLILDPMTGSGTVVRVATEAGHRALGFDLDPLAVLMAKVWTTPIEPAELCRTATEIATRIQDARGNAAALPWIDDDEETREFVHYWFGEKQRSDLRRLSSALYGLTGPVGEALRIALSRTIVTKDRGASLARDVSHSRPHRVRDESTFPVISEFLRSVKRLAQRLADQPPAGKAAIEIGDARNLERVTSASVDAVITSPPYLNAIDYLRGHRLALVWLGYRIGDLRAIRSASVGAERKPDPKADAKLAETLTAAMGSLERLPQRERRMLDRYVLDLHAMVTELRRVLRPDGKAVFVIGNSSIRGVFIRNSVAVSAAAQGVGFRLVKEVERTLPPNRRYLPPPCSRGRSDLERRMRTETVLSFARP